MISFASGKKGTNCSVTLGNASARVPLQSGTGISIFGRWKPQEWNSVIAVCMICPSFSLSSFHRSRTGMVKLTKAKTFQAYLDSCHRRYSCVHCRAHLANHDDLISKVNFLVGHCPATLNVLSRNTIIARCSCGWKWLFNPNTCFCFSSFSAFSLSKAVRAEPTCSILCECTYFHCIAILGLLNVQTLFIECIKSWVLIMALFFCFAFWPAGRILILCR